ncbi:MAG TPA: hypothetical protein EYP78_00825 [Candidatus Omnitrophica bacterium]|nr:hypothetical protein [Candidatus Omnitrophota bacterium]
MDEVIFGTGESLALSASAGTGKTRALTLRFLNIYLQFRNLSSIYALTFTNKATQEMRARIIHYLHLIGGDVRPLEEEEALLRLFKQKFRDIHTTATVNSILANLSDLNISTIHSFLHTILKTIPFHGQVLPDFKVIEESEADIIIDEVVDDFLSEATSREDLKRMVEHVLRGGYQNVKNTLKEIFSSLLPHILVIEKLFGTLRSSLEETRKKTAGIFASFQENSSRLISLLKSSTPPLGASGGREGRIYSNRYLTERIAKIEGSLENEEALVREIMELMTKSYFLRFLENLKNSGKAHLSLEIENLTHLIRKEAEDFTLLKNRKCVLENLILFHTLYERFQVHKREMNVLTFRDLENYAYHTLVNNQLKEYLYFKSSSQIEHLLIDEFQDTSIIQWSILKPIVEELTAGEGKSFFYVGDPNQAIYRFRGGESRLFRQVKDTFPGKINSAHLKRNYRSKKEIVQFVNRLFSTQPDHKPMEAVQKEGGWVRVEHLGEYKKKESREATHRRVIEIVKILKSKGYAYSDIALLVRRNEAGVACAQSLEEAEIPTRSESKAFLTHQEEVQDIMNLLRWLENPSEDFYLSLVLLSPLFSLREREVAQLKGETKGKQASSLDSIDADRQAGSIYQLLELKYPEREVTKNLKKILNMTDLITPYQLLSFLYSELKVMEKYSYTEPLLALLKTVYELEKEKSPSLSTVIEYLQQYGSTIELKGGEIEGVRILTCHKAKGLEFPVVILPETVWEMGRRENDWFLFEYGNGGEAVRLKGIYYRRDSAIKIFKEDVFEQEKKRLIQDEMNNLYVAVTRAKEGLWILGYESPRMAHTWFDFIVGCIRDEMKNGTFSTGEIEYQKAPQKRKVSPPTKIDIPSTHIRERRYLTPTEERAVLTDKERDAMRWGEIFHYALSKIIWIDEENLTQAINYAIDSTRRMYGHSREVEKEITEKLNASLQDILTDEELKLLFRRRDNASVKVETPIYFTEGTARISAKIDRLILGEHFLEIADYKTGSMSIPARGWEREKYLRQMKSYRDGLSKIYPDKEIRCYFIWLDKPRGERVEKVF